MMIGPACDMEYACLMKLKYQGLRIFVGWKRRENSPILFLRDYASASALTGLIFVDRFFIFDRDNLVSDRAGREEECIEGVHDCFANRGLFSEVGEESRYLSGLVLYALYSLPQGLESMLRRFGRP
jgi:hypothetical protein